MFKRRRWLSVVVALVAMLSLVLAGCAGNENGTANNGLGTEEPLGEATEEPLDEAEEPLGEATEEPLEEPTEELLEEPTEEVMPTEEATPTLEPTATLEATPTLEAAPGGETMTDTTGTDPGGFGGPWALSSRVLDLPVITEDGHEIADVEEILFDANGQLMYAVFNVSDYLELDEDRTVAVPWDMLDVRTPVTDTEGTVDDTDTDTDTATVPDTAPALLYTGTDEQLGQETQIDTGVLDEQGVLTDTTALGLDAQTDMLFQVDDVMGYSAVNENDENLGDVEDLVLNLDEDMVQYTIVGVGGFLGIGEKSVAIPWEQMTYDEENETFVAPVASEDLESAPELDYGALDSEGFPENWNEDVDSYWDETLPETGAGAGAVSGATDEEGTTEEDTGAIEGEAQREPAESAQWALASELMDAPVQVQGEEAELGIQDVLYDVDGQIRYVVLDLGDLQATEPATGTEGTGDLGTTDSTTQTQETQVDTVAVPYESFTAERVMEEMGDTGATDTMTDTDGTGATDTMTDTNGTGATDTMTDAEETQEQGMLVLTYTGTGEDLAAETPLDLGELDNGSVITDATGLGLDAAADTMMLRMDNLDYNLVNEDGNRINDVDDLVLNLQQGTVGYLIIGVGGFLGIGQDYVAVPWDQVTYDEAEDNLVLTVSQADAEVVRDAPTINLRDWRDTGFPEGWNEQVDVYWNEVLPQTGPGAGPSPDQWALASELQDALIQNENGEDIANVENILFDVEGQIQYVIFNLGNYLDDAEDRTVAAEWSAFQVTNTMTDTGATDTITGTGTMTETEGITGTDTMTDTQRTDRADIEGPLFVYTGTDDDLRNLTEIDADLLDDADVITDTAALGLDGMADGRWLKMDNLDYNIVNQDGDDIGAIDDLVVNIQDGVVEYLVVGVGGFLGIGRDYVAVPWNLVSYDETANALTLPVSAEDQAAFEDAPTINLRTIRNEGFSPAWNMIVDTYWENFGSAEPM